MARVLIVEDNPANMTLATLLVEVAGHTATGATDAEAGLAIARAERPDLILMDIQLPGMDGLEATALLKRDQATRAIPVIALTALAMKGDEARIRAAGCDGYIAKPLAYRDLFAIMAAHLAVPVPAKPKPAPRPDVIDHAPRVLIVGDEAHDQRLLEIMLGAEGFDLATAASGEEALAMVARQPPDLILLDVRMGGIDGGQVTARIKGNPATRNIPVIIVTALDDQDARLCGLNTGAEDFLTKPVNRVELRVRVKNLLRLKAYGEHYDEYSQILEGEVVARTGELVERTHTLDALRRQSELILHSIGEGVYGVDLEGRITMQNAVALRLLGWEAAEIAGRMAHEVIHHTRADGSPYAWTECPIYQTLQDGEVRRTVDDVFWTKSGSAFPVEYLAAPMRDALGHVAGVVVTFRDISERQQAEEALKQSERRFRDMLANVRLLSIMLDTEGRITYCNDYLLEITGWLRAELVGGLWSAALIPPELHAGLSNVYASLLEDQPSSWHHESDILTRSGARRLIRWNNSVLRSAAGQVIGTASLGEDITEQKRAEASLREAQATLEHVVSASPAVLYALHVRGEQIVPSWVSNNIEHMLGFTATEATSSEWWAGHVHPDDLDRVRGTIQKMLGEADTGTQEYRIRHKDGTYCWVRDDERLLRDAAGAPSEIVGAWSDVTEKRSLEAQLVQAQKMESIGRLAGGIAHDFNNLLGVILGYGSVLLGKVQDQPVRSKLEQIVKAAERAAGLTRQLLAFSRKQVLQPKIIDLNALVSDVETMLRRLIGEDIQLTTLLNGLGQVRADPGQLEQVLMNLVVNARDAMPQGGRIIVETSNVLLDESHAAQHPDARPGPCVMLSVSDTGVGMTPETQRLIFEPFFTTKGVAEGTGLGLATSDGIIKQSGGHIAVSSELGRGSRFELYLPRVDASVERAPAILALPRVGCTGTILLAEDEPALREITRDVLVQSGYKVLEAGSGEAGIQVARGYSGVIDLLLTDVVMPRMNGRRLAERLAGSRPAMRVLFMSGYTDDAVARDGVLAPGAAFIQKPFVPEALLAMISEVLEHAREPLGTVGSSDGTVARTGVGRA